MREKNETTLKIKDANNSTILCSKRDIYYNTYPEVLSDLFEFVEERMEGINSYSPSFKEFAEDKVELPKAEMIKVLDALNNRGDVWVRGGPASGKTVFGIDIAFKWVKRNNGKCLICDLKDFDGEKIQFIDQVNKEIDCFVQHENKPLLILMDNVHTNNDLTNKLLRMVYKNYCFGRQPVILLLGRNSQYVPSEQKTILDYPFTYVELKATEEAFLCVARRLYIRHNLEIPDNIDSYVAKWIRECGSDLVIFASAFNPKDPEGLNKVFIHEMVRRRYIYPAERIDIESFLDLCILSGLDISTPCDDLWDKSAESLYPLFCQNGTIICIAGKEKVFYSLFHSSLGNLILSIRGKSYQENRTKEIWINHVLAMAERCPMTVAMIYNRLTSGSYSDIIDAKELTNILNNKKGFIERCFCKSPFYIIQMLKKGDLHFSWQEMQQINQEENNIIFKNLEKTPLNYIVNIIRFFDKYNNKKIILDFLFVEKKEVFLERILNSPVMEIVFLLKKLDDMKSSDEIKVILDYLFIEMKEDFLERILNSSVMEIASLIRKLDDMKSSDEIKVILDYLFVEKKEVFLERILNSSVMDIASLYSEIVIKEDYINIFLNEVDLSQLLINEVARNKSRLLTHIARNIQPYNYVLFIDSIKNILDEQKDLLVYMLLYFLQNGQKELANEIVNNYMNKMELDVFKRLIMDTNKNQIASFQAELRRAHINVRPDLWDALIREMVGEPYRPVVSDPEFTQDKLLSMKIDEVTALINRLNQNHMRHKLNCINASLNIDISKLRSWFYDFTPDEKVLFKDTVKKANIRISPEAWDIINLPHKLGNID